MLLWNAIVGFWRRLAGLGSGQPQCDTCKLDYGDACRRPERPNARNCPDYQRR